MLNLYLQKTDSTGFFIIKPRHPSGIETKHTWVEKNRNGSRDGCLLEKREGMSILCVVPRTVAESLQ